MHAPSTLPSPSVPRARDGGRTGYWTRLLPLLAGLALVTRLPSFTRPVWNPDEGFLAVQARLLASGGELYETVVDRKPPLVPWLYQAAFALTGSESLVSVRLLAVLAQLATAAALASLARRRWGDGTGRTAGALYLLVSVGLNPEDAQAAAFAVFILPCTAAAMWCADRCRWGAAGLAVGCAFLAKQTGGAVLLPVLWLALTGGAGRAGLIRLAAGSAAPVLGAALLTDPAGFLFWTVTGSGTYASFSGSVPHVLGRALANTALLAVACAGVLVPLARALRTRTGRTGTADLWLWLAASAGAVTTGLHFFGHYHLQLLPPLALLAAAALRTLPRPCRARALLVSACCCVLFLTWGLLAPRTELDHARRLAEAAARRTGAAEPVLIWGMHPETYWLADRTPPAATSPRACSPTTAAAGRCPGRRGVRRPRRLAGLPGRAGRPPAGPRRRRLPRQALRPGPSAHPAPAAGAGVRGGGIGGRGGAVRPPGDVTQRCAGSGRAGSPRAGRSPRAGHSPGRAAGSLRADRARPATCAPSSVTRRRSSRSAVTTRTLRPSARATRSTMWSSPLPGADSTHTPGTDSTPRAAPSTTSTISTAPECPGTPSADSRSRSRSAAPRRSRHHPSGTDPTTLAASTITSSGALSSMPPGCHGPLTRPPHPATRGPARLE